MSLPLSSYQEVDKHEEAVRDLERMVQLDGSRENQQALREGKRSDTFDWFDHHVYTLSFSESHDGRWVSLRAELLVGLTSHGLPSNMAEDVSQSSVSSC